MAESLTEIKALVRDLVLKKSTNQLTDANLVSYINNFYQHKFLVQIGHVELSEWWRFQTLANTGTYTVAESDSILEDSIRINDTFIKMYLKDQAERFWSDNSDSYHENETLGTGDASTVTFTGTLSSSDRVVPGTFVAGDDTETFEDTNEAGVLVGSGGGSGTITYATRAFSLTFNTPPSNGTVIKGTYATFVSGVPDCVLYYSGVDSSGNRINRLTFRPIPDNVYDVRCMVTKQPTAFPNVSPDTEYPLKRSWGDAIGYGTAVDYLRRRGNEMEAQMKYEEYTRLLGLINRQIIKTRAKRGIKPRWLG